jgi:hypothetical protein
MRSLDDTPAYRLPSLPRAGRQGFQKKATRISSLFRNLYGEEITKIL